MDTKKFVHLQKNLLTGEWEQVDIEQVIAADIERASRLTNEQLVKIVAERRKKQREATRKWRKNVRKKK